MSYHNGSVWPHDTGLIALGLRRAGYAEESITLTKSLIEAAARFSDARLPELFCGFGRDQRFNSSPTAYIVSCSPQAWAAGCIFMLLHTIVDVRPDIDQGKLHVDPVLPDLFRRITIGNLKVGSGRISIAIEKRGDDTLVESTARGKLQLKMSRD